jgi:hypothetical protein
MSELEKELFIEKIMESLEECVSGTLFYTETQEDGTIFVNKTPFGERIYNALNSVLEENIKLWAKG